MQQVEGGPSQPVEPGDDNGIASAYRLEHPRKLRPVAPGSTDFLRIDLLAARSLQRCLLDCQVLTIGADPRVTDVGHVQIPDL